MSLPKIEKKKTFCRGCMVSVEGSEIMLPIEGRKDPQPCCPHCCEMLSWIHPEKLDYLGRMKFRAGKVLGDENTPRSWSKHYLTFLDLPLEITLSTESNFCIGCTLDGQPARHIKRYVDEDFSEEAGDACVIFYGGLLEARDLLNYIKQISYNLQRNLPIEDYVYGY